MKIEVIAYGDRSNMYDYTVRADGAVLTIPRSVLIPLIEEANGGLRSEAREHCAVLVGQRFDLTLKKVKVSGSAGVWPDS